MLGLGWEVDDNNNDCVGVQEFQCLGIRVCVHALRENKTSPLFSSPQLMCETRIYHLLRLLCSENTRRRRRCWIRSACCKELEYTGIWNLRHEQYVVYYSSIGGVHVFLYYPTCKSCEVRISHGKFSSLWRACALGFGSRLFTNIAKKRLTRFLTPLTLLLTFFRVFYSAACRCKMYCSNTYTHTLTLLFPLKSIGGIVNEKSLGSYHPPTPQLNSVQFSASL